MLLSANPLNTAASAHQDSPRDEKRSVVGKVVDTAGEPLPGATIQVKGSIRGVITDIDGNFEFPDCPIGNTLVVSFVGMETIERVYNGEQRLDFEMETVADELEEVTVVAFARQKKESVLASISTVRPSELKVPSSNLTTALAGRVAGLISYQRSGEPGQDDASFFVRGVTSFSYAAGPLILIDGVEMTSTDLSRLQTDDIASFSIMKDATATALYGARGANGVILVTTKEGREGAATISFRYETSFTTPTMDVDLADPVTYMRLNNQAVATRDPLAVMPYSRQKIDMTERGVNPLIYPANDWYNLLFKDFAFNQRANFNVSGGGKVARYYIAGTYSQDNGILKVDKQSNFNNNIDLRKYLLRSNININVTPTTEAVVRLHGTFDDYTGPIDGGSTLYQKVMRSDPALFPAYYPKTDKTSHVQHIMFGNHDGGNYINPYADMVKGYRDYTRSLMLAQFELKQDLGFITEGLNLRGLFSTNRSSYFSVTRSYNPFYYSVMNYDRVSNTYDLFKMNLDGTEYLDYSEGARDITATTYSELALNYDSTFNDLHGVSGLLVTTMRNYTESGAGSLILSLPSRNMGLSGRFTYNFDSRYFTEFNFGYNGSERFARNERFGFFPSVGGAWYVSNEPFWDGKLANTVTDLKLKATYGLVGSDAIGSRDDRFFYLSEVNMDSSAKGYTFGEDSGYSVNGVAISRYANDQITWETSYKTNIGLEVGLFRDFNLMVDFYHEDRKNILMNRSDIPSTMGLQATPQTNVGEASGRGIDFSVDYNKAFANGWWMMGRTNFTWAQSNYKVYDEVDNTETPWLSRVGQPIGQQWGYLAERLFIDDFDVMNSPEQAFGEYTGGDIKYRDINNDGEITSLDMVPIGFPTTPEIIYGFGLSAGNDRFDFSFFFQGLARESFWIDARATHPFVDVGSGNVISKNALLQVYADSHWSETNQDLYALWPRLSNRVIANNTQRSTWFMRDGSFLRLKSVELGYTLPDRLLKHLQLKDMRLYVSGVNLLTFSGFKLWDPEMAGNGLGYPIQKVYNVGIQFSF
jgi:TonB-linked SusC/RagA family outer membrane protein